MKHGFDVIPVGVEHESGVVTAMILSFAWLAIVASTCSNCGAGRRTPLAPARWPATPGECVRADPRNEYATILIARP